eukprot:1403021-Rhodomonas_salina.1
MAWDLPCTAVADVGRVCMKMSEERPSTDCGRFNLPRAELGELGKVLETLVWAVGCLRRSGRSVPPLLMPVEPGSQDSPDAIDLPL